MVNRIESIEDKRERFLDLLLLADPSLELVRTYLGKGYLFALFEEDEPYAVVHLLPQTDSSIEIKNIAVQTEMQGQGYGKSLLGFALAFCRQQGYEKVIVGTGNSSIDNLAFYQKNGFRFLSIVRDFFTEQYAEPIYEHGIHCRDLILLELDLKVREHS